MLNALTFDVEDYFHVHAFESVIPRAQWPSIPLRVCENTRLILELLRDYDTRATFFVLGWVADRHPELVREIADDGHELASHGYAHEAVDTLTREQFRDDVARSLQAIHSACPQANVSGYRAPSFSINSKTPWAYDVLKELGFAYDSSISPASFHDRYGMPSAPRFAYAVGDQLTEIPVSTLRWLGCNWAVAGGGYFRLAPLAFTDWSVRRINGEHQPAVVYLHPWEFDPDQPRVAGASRRSRFRHYVNLRQTAGRLRRLLAKFSFGAIEDVFRGKLHHRTAAAAPDVLPAKP
jgi:polysaccharide deacetylase family protein (PEP-CTERM system associated)